MVVSSKVGVAGVALVFAGGVWLVAAPFVLGYQRLDAGWTLATRADVITGGVLAVAGFAGIFGVIAGRVGELYADARYAAALAASDHRGADRRTTGT